MEGKEENVIEVCNVIRMYGECFHSREHASVQVNPN